jgi:hypothetical protein
VAELRQAFDGFRSQRRRVTYDSGFACPVEARHPPVDCRDQLLEVTRKLARAYRHERNPVGRASRRETFQISPQPPQRQYVLSSGFRAVVVIERDWHAGHAVGTVTAPGGRDRVAAFPKSDEFTNASRARRSAQRPIKR